MLPESVLRRGLLAGAAVTATLVLSACGVSDHSSSDSGMNHGGAAPSVAASAVGTFNDADVTFAQSSLRNHGTAP
ncbi:hypothetical protein [Actinoplanes aureus]|uniref:Uncharacterized protein n=1 Tax=Actinoplanes aureus TaxID=2792083 RepID=A0A931G1F7_9ACTN|nr:hypothetical protein [Actinoplanes aureus]MBG0566652.1 hypothetical protein [Actinoplanes aureus]